MQIDVLDLLNVQIDDLELLDRRSVCRLFGGNNRPIDAATLYRGIKSGKFPAPVKIGPGSSRWLRSQCEAALRKIIADSQSG
jgi:predicted DNA-binding transcriptional regulator AlpA